MKNYNAKDVNSYIESSDMKAQKILNELRKIIKSTIPLVEEKISWGIPFYRYNGLLAGFSAFKKHVNFGVVTVLKDEYRELLEEKGYKTGKKTFQIKFDQKVPATIIKQILKAEAEINEIKKGLK